ncbi:hypothetical protein JNUCC64_28005 [Streptomyces sp. JNUCC 64]
MVNVCGRCGRLLRAGEPYDTQHHLTNSGPGWSVLVHLDCHGARRRSGTAPAPAAPRRPPG